MKKRVCRVRCPYCGRIVTGRHIGRTIYGPGCKDEQRCKRKFERGLTCQS